MRTVCPSCQAAYDVPESVLAARRTLRCARCATDFVALAEGLARERPPLFPASVDAPLLPVARPFAPIAGEPVGRRPGDAIYLAPPQAAAMPPAVMASWVVSFVALIAMGWAFVAWRGPIMQAWPASTRLYALLKLA